ncbi:MAG TPA: signal peptidase I [Bryobacteraceae bacterium]|jgi:signal peptidase I|nr:signal peptidase I [Bryobacteraceae bacterium]
MAPNAATIKPVDSKQTAPTAHARETPRNSIAEWAVTILLLLFGTTTLVQAFVIPSGSMEDTLVIGDHLLVDKLAYAPEGPISKYLLPYEQPKHGDIIVFRFPVDISQTFVKRVIGVPGDRLKMVNRVVYRNGVQLNEPYVYHKFPYDASRDNFPGEPTMFTDGLQAQLQRDMLENHVVNGEIVVPPNQYFAMGDNRDNSLDSRYWGFVPRENIIGKPLLIYWSYQAPSEDLTGSSVNSLITHFIDLGEHFFTRTRWERTFRIIRGFPDARLADHPLPLNPGSPNP